MNMHKLWQSNAVLLALLLALLLVTSAGLSLAQRPEPQGEISLAATVNSRINYQGVLKESGAPMNGSRDMTFRLYNNSICTIQVGSDIAKPGVAVANGLFSVNLDVDQGLFNGQGLWLQVVVSGFGLGCQELLPTPYALSLRPGAQIGGNIAGGATLRITNTYSAGTIGSAIYATNYADTSPTIAGYHQSDGPGIYGYAAGAYPAVEGMHGGSGSAVAGYVSNSSAIGVYGSNSSYGGTGVKGYSYGGVGVEGRGGGIGYIGVLGSAPSYGGYFTAEIGYGLYATGPMGAGQFDGDVRQTRTADGLVKASAYAYCSSGSSFLSRSFNLAGGTISIASGDSNGKCIIDFGFKVNDRFFAATGAVGEGQVRGVTCFWGATETKLDCFRWNKDGVGMDGYIMVTIY